MNGFGRARFGGQRKDHLKLKDGKSVFRILPPIGEAAETGRWSQFYAIHYGYKNSDQKMRVFQSPLVKNNKTKMVEVPDAALDRINQLTAKLEEAKKQGDENMVQQLLKLVGGQKSRYNLDSNHYMNVIDLQGNIGTLKIRHKAKLALDIVIKELRDSGIEPLDPENGRFFVFSRSGTNRDTVYQVSVYKEKIEVPGVGTVEKEVTHTITEEIAKRCFVINKDGSLTYKDAANLATLFKKPTAEQVKRMVLEGEKAVDEILDAKDGSSSGSDDEGGSEEETETLAPEAVATNTVQLAEATPTAPAIATPVATAQATQAAPTVATPVAAAKVTETAKSASGAPKTTAEAVSEQTDSEFLKSLGL